VPIVPVDPAHAAGTPAAVEGVPAPTMQLR
jgi:hypothetical protein